MNIYNFRRVFEPSSFITTLMLCTKSNDVIGARPLALRSIEADLVDCMVALPGQLFGNLE